MNRLEQITKLVSDLGLTPSDVVKYWQDRGLLSEQEYVLSAILKNKSDSLDFRQRVKKIIADKTCCKIEEIKEHSSLRKDLFLDELDEVEVFMELEKQFKINLPDEKTAKIKTIGDLIQIIGNYM